MKIKTTNLWILFGIITILLINGCIGESPEKWRTFEEQPETEKEQQITEIIQEENAEAEEVNETEYETEPSEDVNKTGSVETGDYSDMDWCEDTLALTITDCPKTRKIWTQGVVDFKGKLMCHAKYFVEGSDGERLYDWYFTKNKKEIYRVITYPNGSVEETKIEKSQEIEKKGYNLGDNNICEADKYPYEMVLGLNDLLGYNVIQDKTGVTTKEEHTYSPEKLSEMGWNGGYKTAFENEKLYLFSLDLAYKKYLKEGVVDEQLRKAFKDNKISLSTNSMTSEVNNRRWKVYKNLMKYGKAEYYLIEETGKELKIYEESLLDISNYRFIFNTNSIYSKDKIKEVFDDAKQVISASAVFASTPQIGDECVLYKKELTERNINYTAYILIFRKLNVYEEIQIVGLSGIVEENEIIEIAKIVEEKVE